MKLRQIPRAMAFALVLGLGLALLAVLASRPLAATSADPPPCGFDGTPCPFTGGLGPVSVEADPDTGGVTSPSAPAFGALVYDPDFVTLERAARERLKRGLDARQALSPYQGNVEFETYVKRFDYEAGFSRVYTLTSPYSDTLTLMDLIDRADQDLREARDMYAYLAVYSPEHRFRADARYVSDEAPGGYSDYWGATQTLCGDAEDPDPADPSHSGEVLPPVIDWCDFPARLRQSVREAANLRMLFGQQFMVDAMGLHFSGIEFIGGEQAVNQELAQLRAAKYQYELAEHGLVEALDRVVGSGCHVSDFYKQPEWSLLSRAMESQETAQHHIAVRQSYLGIESAEEVPYVRGLAQDTFRKAATEGYIRLIGMAGLGVAPPLGVGCDVGERPDGLLAAEMAANLVATRRQAHEMADGRNVFGFDVSFTPARPYLSSAAGPGLYDEAESAAQYAKELQNDEVANTRAFDDSQQALRDEIEEIQQGIDDRIESASGCVNLGDDEVWYECVSDQIEYLAACSKYVTDTVEYEKDGDGHPDPTRPVASTFDKCMAGDGDPYPVIKDGEAKQALLDLRAVYVGYAGILSQAQNINERVQASDDRNATVTHWLYEAGAWETAANAAEIFYEEMNCIDFGKESWVGSSIACTIGTAAWGTAETVAGIKSMNADINIENAEYHREVENLLLDMSELAIDAYAAQQQFFAKKTAFRGLLQGMQEDLWEAKRQRAYFAHSPANDPSFRMVRDSSRMVLAKQMAYAARTAYLAARRAEYEYAIRLAPDFRISDIYRSRTADDILRYLENLEAMTNNKTPYGTNARPVTISVAQHVLLLTDEALAKKGFTDPAAAEAERVRLFREWLEGDDRTSTPTGGKPVLRFTFATSLLEDGLLSDVILENYDSFWLHKVAGFDYPVLGNNGVSINLVTEEQGLSYREARLTQGGTVHLRSQAGCIFDYKLIAPAFLLGQDWPSNQDPEVATASFLANVNGVNPYDNGFRASEFQGRGLSASQWLVEIFSGAPSVGLEDMDLQQLTDIELIFSTSYASRTSGEPELSECTRIDY